MMLWAGDERIRLPRLYLARHVPLVVNAVSSYCQLQPLSLDSTCTGNVSRSRT